jgi:uroporphyrinogen III methyltransferase/synthase
MENNNKTIISTLPLNSGRELIESLLNRGLHIVNLPMIKIAQIPPNQSIKRTILKLNKYTLLVFTSRNGVVSFFNTLKTLTGTYYIPDTLKIAAIGEATANELTFYGHQTNFISKISTAAGLLEYLTSVLVTKKDNILLALGKLAPDYLLNELNKIAFTERVDVYDTAMPTFVDKQIINQVKKKKGDLIIFSSPSAFNNFIKVSEIEPEDVYIPIATIGNTTAAHINDKGYKVSLVASKPDYNVFATEIIKFFIRG